MGNGNITEKQSEILEYIKAQILEEDFRRQCVKSAKQYI